MVSSYSGFRADWLFAAGAAAGAAAGREPQAHQLFGVGCEGDDSDQSL
jgi:hypothetical protein